MKTPERSVTAADGGEAPGDTAGIRSGAPKLLRSPLQRALLQVLAVLSLGVAVLGLVTPGLPSTEFVLLAAWAAARSSPRFHAWLLGHRLFGPVLRDWNDGHRVNRRAKWAALLSMLVCAALLWWLVPHRWAVVLAIASMACVQVWLWTRPEA